MRLAALTLRNFKSIGDKPVRIEFKPITLLFGPNSAGKSTIVQALHYISEILEHYNCDPGHTEMGGALDLGGFQNLVHKHDIETHIRLRIDFDLAGYSLSEYIEPYPMREYLDSSVPSMTDETLLEMPDPSAGAKTAWVDIQVSWSMIEKKPYVARYEIGINGELFGVCSTSPDLKRSEISELNFLHPVLLPLNHQEWVEQWKDSPVGLQVGNRTQFEAYIREESSTALPGKSFFTPLGFVSTKGALPHFGHPLILWLEFEDDKKRGFYNLRETKRVLSQGLVGPGENLRDGLRRLLYLGPLREIPARSFDAERSPNRSRWASGLAAWDVLHREGQPLVDKVNEWLEKEDRLNTGYAIRLKRFKEIELNSPVMFALTKGPDLDMLSTWEHIAVLPTYSRITLWDEARGLELLPQDVGVGISQLLPVVVAALHHKRGIAAIEQPELHIHPALQVKLGDLFITQIRDNKSGVDQINDLVFLIETHSEHLILRLLRRIRETHENELPPGAPAVKPGEIAVYYVEPGEDGVRIKHLRVDETGEFVDRWPHGFFEERTEELF